MSYVQIQKGRLTRRKPARYAHLAWNEWDPRRKRSVQRRFYLGRVSPDGRLILNKRFCGGGEVSVAMEEVRRHARDRTTFEAWLRTVAGGPLVPESVARVDMVGDAWLIRHLAASSGLAARLAEVFGPAEGGALCGLAAHQMVTGHPLYRAECWLSQRELPEAWRGREVSTAHVHGFVARVGADAARREAFLEHWVQQHRPHRALLCDTTSVSSYSDRLDLAEWGYNRDGEVLPQVNFLLATTPEGRPLFYRVLPGSLPDVRTLSATLRIAEAYGIQQPCLSLDRGYYSAANVRDLLEAGCGFVLGVPWSVGAAQALFRAQRARLQSPRRAFLYRGAPLRHVRTAWPFGEVELSAHLFFDPARHTEGVVRLERTVLALAERAERETFGSLREAKRWIAENAGRQAPGLRVVTDADGRWRVAPKPHWIAAASAHAGYTLILTFGRDPAEETPERVLRDYRARDRAEKLFDAFKTEQGQYRLRTASDDSVQGRFFVGFLALALRAELEERMRSAGLHKSLTEAAVLDELGKAKALITRTGARILLEVSKRQRTLLAALKVPELT